MIGFTPEGLKQLLNRMEDSNEARLYAKELFLKFLKCPRTIHNQDERNEMIEMLDSLSSEVIFSLSRHALNHHGRM